MTRRLLPLLALCMALAVLPARSAGGASSRGLTYAGPVELPDTGALFGVHLSLDAHNGFDRRQAMLDFETLVGRPMAIDREFYLWDDAWPTADDEWSRDQGRTLYFSWDAAYSDGTCVMWADIANGLHDAEIDAQAEAIKAFGAPVIFSFAHEPSTAVPSGEKCGTPIEYQDAWRHLHDRFVQDQVTNATYALTLTALSFEKGTASSYYPGDDVVDVVAADGYNWFGCEHHQGPWREPIQIFQPFHTFGASHGKPMIIAEYGTGEDDAVPGKKGQWFTNFADLMKEWQDIKGVSYFNVGSSCARYVDSSESSLEAFQADGADPYFDPPAVTKPVTVTDSSFMPRTVSVDRGQGVLWNFTGSITHQVTDSSGMGLFDSGVQSPGAAYTFYFIGAGTYPYKDALSPTITGMVKVPMDAQPPTGGVATTFTITWAANHAPTGYAFDVQIRRPGSPRWRNWLANQNLNLATFVPDSGTGNYSFRARYHNTANGNVSQWSAAKSIVVS